MTRIDYEVQRPERVLLSVESRVAHLKGMDVALYESAMVVYEATRHWFESGGEGSWPQLAEATVASKASRSIADPRKILYESGDLFHSVTSPTGPHSYFIPMHDGIVIGAVWTPIKALAEGTHTAGRDHTTRIPARPIFPPIDSATGLALMREIGHILLYGSRSSQGLQIGHSGLGGSGLAPAFPGALVGRSTLGTFLPLG